MNIIKKITVIGVLMSLALVFVGTTSLFASEVTGTLSSSALAQADQSGSINGTVTSSNGSGGGGGSSSRRTTSNTAPQGQVLGASTGPLLAQAATPSFPNTGFDPEDGSIAWNSILGVIGILAAFYAVLSLRRKQKRL
jgi:hypothetical protein